MTPRPDTVQGRHQSSLDGEGGSQGGAGGTNNRGLKQQHQSNYWQDSRDIIIFFF